MSIALIRYNLSYYAGTLKYIGPCLIYLVFFSVNYQVKPISVWGNCYLTAMATFVLSNWIGTSFINSEDKTQRFITLLKVKNDLVYRLSKIASVLIFIFPFYALFVFYPVIFGFYTRPMLISEIFISVTMHFLFSLLGVSVSTFFDSDIYSNNNNMNLPTQAAIILITVLPLASIFKENILVKYFVYLLPPVNFLTEKLFMLKDDIYLPDSGFLGFAVYAAAYSFVLIAAYCIIIRKRSRSH